MATGYIPPHKRQGFKGEGATMPKNFETPATKARGQLEAIGFVQGTAGQLYYPKDHPHAHIGIGPDAFMAYSEGKGDGKGISMYRDKKVQQGYQTGLDKLKTAYGDGVEAKLSQAVVILNEYHNHSAVKV